MRRVILLCILLSTMMIGNHLFSQIPVGEWRDHFSYHKTSTVADAGTKVYAASELALFSYDKDDGVLEKLNKINGLTDAGIQRIAYDKANEALVIVYIDSNIDILKGNTIYNLSDLKRKQISGNKSVNNISFYDGLCFLSCGFGIVVIDTKNLEFVDTFYIGENASYIQVNDITFDGTSIYAATNDGLYYSAYDLSGLWNFNNWHIVETIPENDNIFNIVRYFKGYLWANRVSPITGKDTLYVRENETWSLFTENLDNIKSITENGNYISFTTSNRIKVYDNALNLQKELNWYAFANTGVSTWTSMNYGMLDDDDNILIADNLYGMVYQREGKLLCLLPNGPFNNATGRVKINNGRVITTCGNINAKAYYSPVYNVFKDENWTTYSSTNTVARNLYSIAVDPVNQNRLWIGSWGFGIYEFIDNVQHNEYNLENSSLQAIDPFGYGYIRINDLVFDVDGNLWISNPEVGEPVSVMTPENEWKSFNFGGQITNNAVDEIFVTENNYKWIIQNEGNGVLVFDDNHTPLVTSDDTYKKIIPVSDDGESFDNIYHGLEDKNGEVWLATEKGVIVYYNPADAFTDNFIPDRIQLTSYGNDTTQQYLLVTDIVTDIEIDGGNRKWLGTQNSGVFLVSENGKQELLHFDKYNSPLISNSINDLAVDPVSGEVFILTDKGIMSYRGDATEGTDLFGDVYVFPNPVRPGYSGKITVTGLAADVNVKITDTSGNLVFETNANGGQAVWDGKTFDGRKVSTGVYLVFCTNEDGSQTYVTKFLFLN
jgi:hypothetical protein